MEGEVISDKGHAGPADEVVQLPKGDREFHGKIGPTTDVSTPDFPRPYAAPEGAPNVIIIMTDDIGFGSGSTFGGPVETPSMTKLFETGGVRYNRFHTTATCSPTRASLLTGRYPHNVGVGIVKDRSLGYPGYNSVVPKSCGNVAEVLNMNGYGTGWFGKNHNIPDWETSLVGPFDFWPTKIGFEKFYGFIGGDCNHWQPTLFEDTTPIEPAVGNPEYHLDTDLADQAISWYTEQKTLNPNRPVFMFYCPGAAHAPHHVPEKWMKKYKGKFDHGWDVQREETWKQQKKMGIIPEKTKLTPRPDNLGAWDDLDPEKQKVLARMMECYAGFLDLCDHNIGRVIDAVESGPGGDNTLLIYIQGDNGGSAEGSEQGTLNEFAVMGNGLDEPWEYIASEVERIGSKYHYNLFPVGWGWAMNSPMQWTKGFASHFGGTRNGMVMKYPGHMRDTNVMRTQFHHVCDLAPTIYEAAGVTYPVDSINGVKQKELDGVPMNYTWKDANAEDARKRQIFEMKGNRGIYDNGWMACTTPQEFAWVKRDHNAPKITASSFEWELYNVAEDFSQGDNVAHKEEHEKKLKDLKALWWDEAAKNQMLPLNYGHEADAENKPLRPSLVEGKKKFVYTSRISRIPEGSAPPLKNVGFAITAVINVPKGKDSVEGVIITQGGRFGGWGIVVLKDNKPTFVYRLSQINDEKHVVRLDSSVQLTPGNKHVIKVVFDYEGDDQFMENGEIEIGAGGTFTMTVDGSDEIKAYIPQSVKSAFSHSETMDIGKDTGTPVLDEYDEKMPFEFTGEIKKIEINIEELKLSKRALKELYLLEAMAADALD